MKKIKGKIIKFQGDIATIQFEENLNEECLLTYVSLEKPTKLRSKDANALSWTLIDRISHKLHIPREEVYDQMLQKYGVATYIVVKPEKAQQILEVLGHSKILGDITINGKRGTQIQVFLGSSTYDSKEFCEYMQGIISECEEMQLVIPDKDTFIQAALQWNK